MSSRVESFQVSFHSQGALKLPNSKGKAGLPRLHFESEEKTSTRHDIALKSFTVLASNKPPKLGFWEKRKYALLRVQGTDQNGMEFDGWVKVNRSSVAKRFGLERGSIKGDITDILSFLIDKEALEPGEESELQEDIEKRWTLSSEEEENLGERREEGKAADKSRESVDIAHNHFQKKEFFEEEEEAEIEKGSFPASSRKLSDSKYDLPDFRADPAERARSIGEEEKESDYVFHYVIASSKKDMEEDEELFEPLEDIARTCIPEENVRKMAYKDMKDYLMSGKDESPVVVFWEFDGFDDMAIMAQRMVLTPKNANIVLVLMAPRALAERYQRKIEELWKYYGIEDIGQRSVVDFWYYDKSKDKRFLEDPERLRAQIQQKLEEFS